MATFEIQKTFKCERTIQVEAESFEEAQQLADENWYDYDLIYDEETLVDYLIIERDENGDLADEKWILGGEE